MRESKIFKYEQLHKYPGMRPRDVVIWNDFIISNPTIFKTVYYDVHVGDPVYDPTKLKEMLESGMYDVSCWCIDVVALSDVGIHVIEIKPNAGAGALGQALAYTKLLRKYYSFDEPLQPTVLTNSIGPITEEAAKLLGVILLTP